MYEAYINYLLILGKFNKAKRAIHPFFNSIKRDISEYPYLQDIYNRVEKLLLLFNKKDNYSAQELIYSYRTKTLEALNLDKMV